jgi:tetratricopeptide (TPR) repeat protein
MLIVTAIVNLHHFMIDGVVWKLRDARVSAALTTDTAAVAEAPATLRRGRNRALIVAGAVALVALAAVDQWRYRLTLSKLDAAALQQAIAINPYDAPVHSKLLSTLIESGRDDEAREELDALIRLQPQNADALVNAGVLARRGGRLSDAIAYWDRALRANADQPQVHLYLAEAFHESGHVGDAAPHYQQYLEALTRGQALQPAPDVVAAIVLKFGDALEQSGHLDDARTQFDLAARIARQAGAAELEAQARVRLERR